MEEDRRGLTPRQLAKALGVPFSSVRRLLRDGCPRLLEGSPGRGHGARLDPVAVVQWSMAKKFPGFARQADRDVLATLASTLYHAWRTDKLKGLTLPVEFVLLKIFERAYLDLQHEPLDNKKDLPDEMRLIRANFVNSPEDRETLSTEERYGYDGKSSR